MLNLKCGFRENDQQVCLRWTDTKVQSPECLQYIINARIPRCRFRIHTIHMMQ